MRLPLTLVLLLSASLHAGPQHTAPFARDLGDPRVLLELEDGTVLVSRPSTFDVIALRDRDHDGRADEIRTAVSSVEGAWGLAYHDGTLYVAGARRLVAAERLPDGSFAAWRDIVRDLPGATPQRPLSIGPDGRLYLGVDGTLWQIERDGLTRRVCARGAGEIAAITFDDKGMARPLPRRETKEAAETLYARDGAVYRVTSDPPAMTPAGAEPVRTILSQAFAVRDLRGAEAVLHDEEQDVYLVSGAGFVARLSPEGGVADRSFIGGVETPRGMALRGDELWIADGTSLRVFHRLSGRHVGTIDLAPHGAVLLNHVAVGGDNLVYVTDTDNRTGEGRIFRVQEDGEIEVVIQGEELRSPAGIAWDGTRFLVAQAYGNEIVEWQPGHRPNAVLRGPGAYGGLAVLPNGMILVVSENDGAIHLGTSGELRPLFARPAMPAGIAFDRKRNRLLVPSAEGSSLEGWTLPPLATPPRRTARERPIDSARSKGPGDQNLPAARSFGGRISRQVVHQPVTIVSTNSSGRRSRRISSASRWWS